MFYNLFELFYDICVGKQRNVHVTGIWFVSIFLQSKMFAHLSIQLVLIEE